MKPTEPLPAPLAPEVMVSHAALLDAVHAQPAPAVTETADPLPPAAPIDWLVGAIENVQGGGAAACSTEKVCPAIVRLPVRAAPPLAATLNATVPPPRPSAPDVIEIHGLLLPAVQAHPAEVVTVVDPLPPAAPSDNCVGDS